MRPRHFAEEIPPSPARSAAGRARFNEASAFRRGNHVRAVNAIGDLIRASMRPRHFAEEIMHTVWDGTPWMMLQ